MRSQAVAFLGSGGTDRFAGRTMLTSSSEVSGQCKPRRGLQPDW